MLVGVLGMGNARTGVSVGSGKQKTAGWWAPRWLWAGEDPDFWIGATGL